MRLYKHAADHIHYSPRHLRAAPLCALLIAGLSACGGGSSSMSPNPTGSSAQSCTSATCGTAVLTLTDAAGDFLTYKIDLVSLQLKKSDGSLVETLPSTTTVDFAKLVNLGEILSARQIPSGDYASAQVTVDYTNASIMVDDGAGNPVAVSPLDSSGAAIGRLQLDVQLDKQHPLAIKGGKSSRIAFDFNLLASNTVDLTAKTVTVSPVLVASVVATDTKELRIRGSLISVDTSASTYTVQVKPFNEKDDDQNSPLIVHTSDTTAFEINGMPLTGAAGLTELAAQPADTVTVAYGSLQSTDQLFTAARVRAGSSVEGGGMDHLSGNVIARSGNSLTLHAAELEDRDGNEHFQSRDVTVIIADATKVTTDGQSASAPAHTIAELSVGSRVDAFGTAATDANGHLTLDATAGRVRLEFTRLKGTLNEVGTQQITMTLSSIDRMPLTLFDFAGTGIASAQNSDPAKYLIATGNLPLDAFSVGAATQSIGFVAPFGAAPPDFNAVTLANSSGSEDHGGMDGGDHDSAELEIDWGKTGTTLPFKVLDATHLDLDIANASIGEHHTIEAEPAEIDLKTLATDPSIVPDAAATALFAIGHSQSQRIENFNSFADFQATLATQLNGSVTALRLVAEGRYDSATNTFTARHLVVRLND